MAANRIERVARRDGWTCWLCEGPIDRDAPDRSPVAPTVDHVVPRSRGGSSDLANLRLAHRRCNGERGDHLPELDWPERFSVIDAAPLWQSIARIARRGRPEIVALIPTRSLAVEAAEWARVRARRFCGGDWTVVVEGAGAGSDACTVRLGVGADSIVADPGRPRPAGAGDGRSRARRNRRRRR